MMAGIVNAVLGVEHWAWTRGDDTHGFGIPFL